MTNKKSLFEENLERFARFWPKEALLLETLTCPFLEFCNTDRGELNLKKQLGKEVMYYHSQEGAVNEASQWFLSNSFAGIQILFVYGVGLGYYYDSLQEWLKNDPRRYLVFLEDDLCVVKKLLETEKGSKILKDPQVILHYFQMPDEKSWAHFFSSLHVYFEAFNRLTYQLTALKFYREERSVITELVFQNIHSKMGERKKFYSELLDFAQMKSQTLYENVMQLPHTYCGEALFEEFYQIPALLCDAKSDHSNSNTLSDQALLFASGNVMSALNKKGFMPHFGVCEDSDPIQEGRILANHAYEIPFFYSSDFYATAIEKIHGPKLLLSDPQSLPGLDWFYITLGLSSSQKGLQQKGTSSLCHQVAEFLGCYPIFSSPLKLIEGARKHSIHSYDFDAWIHTVIQENPQQVSEKDVARVMHLWEKSLQQCDAIVQRIKAILIPLRDEEIVLEVLPGQVILLQTELTEELVYQHLLHLYDKAFDALAQPELNKLTFFFEHFDQKKKSLWLLHKEIGRVEFLANFIFIHRTAFNKKVTSSQAVLNETQEASLPVSLEVQTVNDLYHFGKGRYQIKDLELNIDFEDHFAFQKVPKEKISKRSGRKTELIFSDAKKNEGQALLLYSEGTTKGEMYYHGGLLHGPSIFYYRNGVISAKSWFVHNQRVGKSWFFFPTGALASLKRYQNGYLQGLQIYYYPSGIVKSLLKYSKGVLDGEIRLFHPNGCLKRLLPFKKGKLHGLETIWNSQGKKVLETEYDEDHLIGTSKTWYDNGQLAKQIDFHADSNDLDLSIWTQEGVFLGKVSSHPQNPLDEMIKKSGELKQVLEETALKLKERFRVN